MKYLITTLIAFTLIVSPSTAQKNKDDAPKSKINSSLVSGLSFRSIGPSLMSGRVADIAVNPNNPDQYYLAIASGGVWKTDNHGTTYNPNL